MSSKTYSLPVKRIVYDEVAALAKKRGLSLAEATHTIFLDRYAAMQEREALPEVVGRGQLDDDKMHLYRYLVLSGKWVLRSALEKAERDK